MKMVSKVIDYKLLDGRRYYKVKWECTWEQEESLRHCQDLVEQFWCFINRVKSEDTVVPVCKKARVDCNANNQNIIGNTSSATQIDKQSSYTNIVPDDEKPPESVQGNLQKLQKRSCSFLPGSDNTGAASDKNGARKKARKIIELPDAGNPKVDSVVHDHTSNGLDVNKQHMNQHDLHDISDGGTHVDNVLSNQIISKKFDIQETDNQKSELCSRNEIKVGVSESSDQKQIEGQELAVSSITAMDMPHGQTQNDAALHWKNPYVQISFMCRVCNEEQPFSNNSRKWKSHFLTHVQGSHPEEEETEDDVSLSSLPEEASLEDVSMIEDPDRPWIQRVEYIIQKWGVSQYVRLVFSCRICGKEQQASHTGNWRNHYNSHIDNRPHSCKKCSKIFKSKNSLTQHLKDIHNDIEGRNVSHACFVCGNDFSRKLDMKRHIAIVHNIDPKTSLPSDSENKAVLHTFKKNVHRQKSNQSQNSIGKHSNNKNSNNKDNLKILTIMKDAQLHINEMLSSQLKSETTKTPCNNAPNTDFHRTFKHTCGICQQRFRKKIDLKCHTIDVHCIDINHSGRGSDSSDSLIPSMVGPGEIDTLQNQTCTNEGLPMCIDIVDVGSIVNKTKHRNTDHSEVHIKEERMSSDEEDERSGTTLTIDERGCDD